MTRFVSESHQNSDSGAIGFGGYTSEVKPSRWRKVLLTIVIVLGVLFFAACTGGWIYWNSLKGTPQYSLALLIDAARNDDQATVGRIVDTDALVDNFMPQITAKAIELYGRGLKPEQIARVQQIAAPLMPAVKDRARVELPRLIRRKTEAFDRVPFGAMVIGADQYLIIDEKDPNSAIIRSKLPEHSFELEMKKEGDLWKVAGVRDDQLATNIARAVGQEIVAVATRGVNGSRNSLGVRNLGDILRQAEDIFK
jgi:hypothetical protein